MSGLKSASLPGCLSVWSTARIPTTTTALTTAGLDPSWSVCRDYLKSYLICRQAYGKKAFCQGYNPVFVTLYTQSCISLAASITENRLQALPREYSRVSAYDRERFRLMVNLVLYFSSVRTLFHCFIVLITILREVMTQLWCKVKL